MLSVYIHHNQWYYVKQFPVCSLFGSICFETISTVVIYHFQNGSIQYVKYLIHAFLCVSVCFVLCFLVVLLGTEHFIVSQFMTAQGYMMDLCSDIDCEFLSTFKGCVLPSKSMCIVCMLCMGLLHIQVSNYCLWVIFFLVNVFVFCTNFTLWSNILILLWQYANEHISHDTVVEHRFSPHMYANEWCQGWSCAGVFK